MFSLVAGDASGLDFVNSLQPELPLAYLYHSPWAAGGVALGDLDGNGLLDVFLGGGPGNNGLYLQTAAWKFDEVAAAAGVAGGGTWAGGAAMVDIDADGDLDLLVCNYDAPLQCFLNDGTGRRFAERAGAIGLDVTDASLMPCFADYDNDGDLDLYLLTNRYENPAGKPDTPPVEVVDGKTRIKPEFAKYYFLKRTAANRLEADLTGRPDYLFRNDGGKFTDVTRSAGLGAAGHGLAAIWWDFDGDGWIDLFVANDFNDPDRLYRNNRDGTFSDVAEAHLPQTAWFSMGADVADMNNDGLFDLFTTDMAASTHYKAKISMGNMETWRWGLENFWPRQAMRNNFFLNTGTARFIEIAPMTGLASTDWTWGVRLADLDNDGRNDLFFSNGAARYFNHADLPVDAASQVGKTSWDLFKDKPPLREANLAFRNEGELTFSNQSRAWGLDHLGISMAAAQGDLDNDGDLDLVVANLDEPVSLYRNDSTTGNALKVRLLGRGMNRSAIGAVVSIESATAGKQVRLMNPVTGFQSSNDHALHFGLGEDEVVRRLTVRWPDGTSQALETIAAGQLLTLSQPAGGKAVPEPVAAAQFEDVSGRVGADFHHRERKFDDFVNQPLLPGKMSQLGSGIAMGDADGDGDDDLFIAGAAGQAGTLFVYADDGKFSRAQGEFAWEADAESEGMAPLWFDADSDGDLDLFVANGSSEFPQRSPHQQDRIYLNESAGGKLRFVATPILTIPVYGGASGPAAVSDFDGDGDLDLFIGGRQVPGKFPTAPDSLLLRNDSNPGVLKFTEVTDQVAPALRKAGMVSSALWSDADGDGRADLLLALEWGSVRLLLNRGGKLEDATAAAGLAARAGWWNSIAGCDLDGDGDIDYAVMNVGLNTKYGTPSADKPALLYYGDMDGSGVQRLIEAKPGKDLAAAGKFLPVRGKSCSSHAIPSLVKKFPTFDSFAKATLDEIYAPQRLESAQRFAADTFESGVLINDGHAHFEWRPLPRLAQASPGFGVVAADFDADGHADLCAVQNLYSREPETGLWRGGIGLMLAGNGDGDLELVPPARSGFVVDGDGKGLVLCDLGGDAWPDLIASQNDGRLVVMRNRGIAGREPLAVRLAGPPGNLQGIGATVRVTYADATIAIAEVTGGSGYLSQSAPISYFPGRSRGGAKAESISVAWPDGTRSVAGAGAGAPAVVVRHGSPP